jgi:NADH:ubiquinone oxidoreductase subunit F (NADH-binding)
MTPLLTAPDHPLLAAAGAAPAPVPWRGGPDLLIPEIAAAGLTGRGGAGFPVARKLAAVSAAGRPPVVVANGAEGEPASGKDAFLLAEAPHLVLDGLALAAEAVGARRAFLVAAPERVAVLRALAVSRGDRVPVEVRARAEAFLAGEETALVAALDGRAPRPADKARRVTEAGVGGAPTLVQNVETLAHLGLIARHGAAWFRSRGTAAEPGTMLVTVGRLRGGRAAGVRAGSRPRVAEAALGTPLVDVLEAAGVREPGPVLVGGFHGAWLAPGEVAAARLSRESLAAWGASPGAGVLAVLAPGASGPAETARVTRYLADASARQCVACINGLPAMALLLERLAAGEQDAGLVAAARRPAGRVAGRGACHHPDGTARLVVSALRVFEEEWS